MNTFLFLLYHDYLDTFKDNFYTFFEFFSSHIFYEFIFILVYKKLMVGKPHPPSLDHCLYL